jgi:hypothetical protein
LHLFLRHACHEEVFNANGGLYAEAHGHQLKNCFNKVVVVGLGGQIESILPNVFGHFFSVEHEKILNERKKGSCDSIHQSELLSEINLLVTTYVGLVAHGLHFRFELGDLLLEHVGGLG